jgi:alkylhydroperoxidase/carboxymuconolactone decarboxylase family protein YurZ
LIAWLAAEARFMNKSKRYSLSLVYAPSAVADQFRRCALRKYRQGGNAMSDKENLMSDAFQVFMREAPQHAKAWMTAAQNLGNASALDKKTESLAYLAVLAVLRLESGIPFHVAIAKESGASRDEVISAILVGLPAAGNVVTRALPVAIQAYDSHKA